MMKTFLTLTMALLAVTAFAGNISTKKQLKIVLKHAKLVRKDLYITGHASVETSKPVLISKTDLDYHYEDNKSPYNDDPLEDDEISELYRCYHSKSCALWSFVASSDYWGGYGTSMHFVLINLKAGKYEEISHTTYAE